MPSLGSYSVSWEVNVTVTYCCYESKLNSEFVQLQEKSASICSFWYAFKMEKNIHIIWFYRVLYTFNCLFISFIEIISIISDGIHDLNLETFEKFSVWRYFNVYDFTLSAFWHLNMQHFCIYIRRELKVLEMVQIQNLSQVAISNEIYKSSLWRVLYICYETTTRIIFCLSFDHSIPSS